MRSVAASSLLQQMVAFEIVMKLSPVVVYLEQTFSFILATSYLALLDTTFTAASGTCGGTGD